MTRLTEDQIERRVERMFDELDRRYVNGGMSTSEYRARTEVIDAWARGQYQRRASPDRI